MIYDVADTSNIANDMIANLAAFTELPAMDNVNVVAMVDLPEQSDPGYPQATLPGIAPVHHDQDRRARRRPLERGRRPRGGLDGSAGRAGGVHRARAAD